MRLVSISSIYRKLLLGVSCLVLPFSAISFTFDSDVAPIIIKYEGVGFHNNPKDPGGPTNYGWTLKSYRQTVNKNATEQDLKKITQTDALILYKIYWWNKYGADKIDNYNLAVALILAQINLGPTRPNKLLQRTVNAVCSDNLTIDGVVGPRTANAVNFCEIWPIYAFMLHDYYMTSPQIAAVWDWAQNGLRKRILHGVEN